jgi:hypothetical protein
MTRFSLCTVLAAATVLAMSNADARTYRTPAAQDRAAAFAGAQNSVTDETSIRQQCAADAAKQWGTTNQDMQTNRDFRYRTCMVEHGVRNP